ncbi:MAG: RNA polymerase sigma factor [Anaerolineae bacterium]|nr:RNA polymerase sigma factor [Anaerolineae bacterium]MDH7472814.1 RNA polymerase sigma factor [Anaerolineae bacterium]
MDLIRRCQAGDEEAFAALFHQYKNLVYKTAYLMLDSADEAEDALQEVFLQVHRSLPTFEPAKGAFTTWLYRITVNHCLNRRRKRRLSASLERVSPALLVERPSFQGRVEDEEAVQQALGRLSQKLRVVIVLRYYLELSYAEIAQILNIPVGTVRSRLNLALKTLRRELGTVPCTFPLKETAK